MTKVILFYDTDTGYTSAEIDLLAAEMKRVPLRVAKGLDESADYSLIDITEKAEINKYSSYKTFVIDYTSEPKTYDLPSIRISNRQTDENSRKYLIRQIFTEISAF